MEPLTAASTLDSLGAINKYVMDAAAAAGLPRSDAYRLRLAVDEIATNIITHGYLEAGLQGPIKVRGSIDDKALTVTLEDAAAPFDPREAPPPDDIDLPPEERKIGGLGVYLALQGVDKFHYERVGDRNLNIFIMNRARPSPNGQADVLTELKDLRRLAKDLKNVVLPLGVALSAEKSFDRLVERILIEAQAICNADAGTFYLRTPDDHLKFAIVRTDSLKIALGGSTGQEVPFPPLPLYDAEGKPNERNVATVVALHGATVNIPDIYHAEGFDFSGARAMDQRNNYRSTSSLTVPLKNNEDQVIGVLQLLNAQDPETGKVVPFNSYSQQVVESLASQAAVALNNHLLLDRQKKLLQIQRDLEIGRTIQAGFLPETLPQLPAWEIGAYFAPAREVSGDFYDVFKLSEGYVALVVADVCNKGIGAALFMALFRSLFRAFSQQTLTRDLIGLAGDSSGSPRMIGAQLASLLVDINALSTVGLTNNYVGTIHGSAYMFATVFFAVLDVNTGLLTYVNAGHDAPAVIGPAGVKARLTPTGPVVGMMPNVPYDIKKVTLAPGDLLYVYTDGVTESRAPDGAFFTEKRMLALLNEPAASAAALLERIQNALRDHIASADPFDDITMLAVRRAPKA